MPLETGTHISDLVVTNPAHSDSLNQADAHLRLIKSVLQGTFPGVAGALTQAQGSDYQFIASNIAPAYSFFSEPTLGFGRSGAGTISVIGGVLRGRGAVPTGAIFGFLAPPAGLGTDYLELDGTTYTSTSFPALAAHLNAGTTFTLPDCKTTGRFLRSRTASIAAGTAQANTMATHSHVVSGATGTESVTHTHSFSGNTGAESADHTHPYSAPVPSALVNVQGGSTYPNVYINTQPSAGYNTGGSSATHTHTYSGTTSTESANHTHSFSVTSGTAGSDTETRPEALSVIYCIKT